MKLHDPREWWREKDYVDREVFIGYAISTVAAVACVVVFRSLLAGLLGFVGTLLLVEGITRIHEDIQYHRGKWPPEHRRAEIDKISAEARAKREREHGEAERSAEEKRLRRYRRGVRKRQRREGRKGK